MTSAPPDSIGDASLDAECMLALLAVDPVGLGGIALRGRPGEARDACLATLRRLVPAGTVFRRMPPGIADDRLLGGLDLTATLAAGRPIGQKGLLAETDGGLLIVPMAERLSTETAARLVATLDSGEVCGAREGLSIQAPARLALVLLDEGIEADEAPPAPLLDRVAFRISLDRLDPRLPASDLFDAERIEQARKLLPDVAVSDEVVAALCEAAMRYGILSLRAPMLALKAARAAAALDGRINVEEDDAVLAARLVLSARATMLPPADEAEPEAGEAESAEDASDPGERPQEEPEAESEEVAADRPLAETVAEAVRVAMPAEILAQLLAGPVRGGPGSGQGRVGPARKSLQRGRVIGARRGELRAGARVALLETMRAAAPWQALRRRTTTLTGAGRPSLIVRSEDIRIKRFKQQMRTTTIFVVDASGSSALHRLADAKGAVELLLAECYVRRDEVALIAFRNTSAELLLPPTRSLTRAKRSLSRLPGGGGTPLAAGILSAAGLALETQRRGNSVVLVFLTDGQANVARDGRGNRPQAEKEALEAARLLRGQIRSVLLIDTAPRPQPKARLLSEAMGARYLPLPVADSGRLSGVIMAQRQS